ncbi:uncharacterized protein LOC105207298 isoform X2 [Solenopsis invicta]|uniref:uncharacterized protein LOC105207298 isoform X2 n=1 Tax=Solenopsis invicta TaxID=13686 RepID=UPI00193EBC45|nr:uncharacterized protein LOC105207298 isoform X2 [Solenopsis invicta]
MGKSSHKSRKRRRSSSSDRIAGLERKMSRLIDILSQSEVRRPRCPSPQVRFGSAITQTSQGSRIETKEVSVTRSFSDPDLLTPQVESADPPGEAGEVETLPAQPDVSLENSSPPPIADIAEDDTGSLVRQLFGDRENEEFSPWEDIVIQTWRDLTRRGLATDQRELLLKKYSPPEPMAFLKAPVLNQECRVALKNNAVVKRDDFAGKNQDQAGIALCALGEAILDFLTPATRDSLSLEARLAVAKVNDGAKILADLFHRLSRARRAQITPALNLTAKTTADAIPSDELLFGSSFGEQIKKAASMQKTSKDIVRTPLAVNRRVQQPMSQPLRVAPYRSGNARAPASHTRTATKRSGASTSRRSYRARSQSRSRRH